MFLWDVGRYGEIIINLNSFASIYFHISQKTIIFPPKFLFLVRGRRDSPRWHRFYGLSPALRH